MAAPASVSYPDFNIGVARWPKHSFHFVFCPSGLLELRSSQGLKPAAFASLSPVLMFLLLFGYIDAYASRGSQMAAPASVSLRSLPGLPFGLHLR